jgi:hypothetical protein
MERERERSRMEEKRIKYLLGVMERSKRKRNGGSE